MLGLPGCPDFTRLIPAERSVPGDIVPFNAGDVITADISLVEALNALVAVADRTEGPGRRPSPARAPDQEALHQAMCS
jgi:hypothetical protein